MPDTRARIRRHVRETPGVHFNRVGRDLDIATGQAQYHLRRLVRDGEIAVERIGGRAHYFDPAFDPWERRTVAFLRRETAREILVRLHADGPTRSTTLADELDLARSTVSWHVSNLVESGIVEEVRRATHAPLARVPRADRDAFFDEVSPSLPDRIVDRFVRTVDSLFERELPRSRTPPRRVRRRTRSVRAAPGHRSTMRELGAGVDSLARQTLVRPRDGDV